MDLLVSCIEGALDLIRNKLQIKIILYFKLIIKEIKKNICIF